MGEIIIKLLAAIGGVGVIIIGFSKLFGGIFRDFIKDRLRGKTELQLKVHDKQLGVQAAKAEKYALQQFEIYTKIWESLQDLREAGDLLWSSATQHNIYLFAEQLRKTSAIVKRESLFFQDDHLKLLTEMFSSFADFKVGKDRLIDLQGEPDIMQESLIPEYRRQTIQHQISQNENLKKCYEEILEQVRTTFRKQLSFVGSIEKNS